MRDRKSVKKKAAFTLAEVLVASTLAILALGILLQFLQSAYRISHEELQRNAAESQIISFGNLFGSDMDSASPGGLTLTSDAARVLIHPVELSDTGSIASQEQLIFWYHESSEKKLRRLVSENYTPFPFDGNPIRLTEAELANIPSSSDFKLSRLFDKVIGFEIRGPSDVELPFIGSPLNLEVKFALDSGRRQREVVFKRSFFLRNAGT